MTIEKKYSSCLGILLLIFCVHVGAQFIQFINPVSFLPPLEEWNSGNLPYEVMAVSQIIIIFVLFGFVLRMASGRETPVRKSGQVYLIFGFAYLVLMIFKITEGITDGSSQSWFIAKIPSLFHLVLASFLILVGHYHFRFGKDC